MDSWGWSPEISSNPNRCNLTPGPGIVSGTESPSTSCPVTTEQWQRRGRRTKRGCHGDLTLISFSRARDRGGQIIAYRALLFDFQANAGLEKKNKNGPALRQMPTVALWRAAFMLGGERCFTVAPQGSDTCRSAGVFTCCQHIVPVTPTGPECKGIRDWFALPLSGHRAIHGPGLLRGCNPIRIRWTFRSHRCTRTLLMVTLFLLLGELHIDHSG